MRVLIALALAALLTSCASPSKRDIKEPVSEPARSAQKELTVDEQNEAAFEVFQEMYEMSGTLSQEELVTVRLEQYDRIINNYPKAGLAQEAHWKKVRIYLRDVDPPALADAERTYDHFAANYPDSVLMQEVQNELIRFYVKKKMWESLLRFTAPIVKENREQPLPMPFYYYGEASYQLGRKEEAKVSFEMAVERIPKRSYLYKMTVDRLVELGGQVPEDAIPQPSRRTRKPRN